MSWNWSLKLRFYRQAPGSVFCSSLLQLTHILIAFAFRSLWEFDLYCIQREGLNLRAVRLSYFPGSANKQLPTGRAPWHNLQILSILPNAIHMKRLFSNTWGFVSSVNLTGNQHQCISLVNDQRDAQIIFYVNMICVWPCIINVGKVR